MSNDSDDQTRAIRQAFYASLRRAAYGIVDDTCPDDLLAPRNVIASQQSLRKTLQSKTMATALALPAPHAALPSAAPCRVKSA